MKKFCNDCGLSSTHHIQTWLDEFSGQLPELSLPKKVDSVLDFWLEKAFSIVGLIKMRDDFVFTDVQARSACFVEEARKREVKFKAGRGPFGYTGHFCAYVAGKEIRFSGLPTADFVNGRSASFVSCKEKTKIHLEKGNFPIAEGRSFWFWQKKSAMEYGANSLGFPLVVKPRSGSVARHVTTNIENEKDLGLAIENAVAYSPAYLVERFIKNSFVYRATVVDFDFVACVMQTPANVSGDGISTIQELVNKKNVGKQNGKRHGVLNKIVIDDTTAVLLLEKKYDLSTVLPKDEVIYLQKNPFLKLGGELIEVTGKVHKDNIQLFKDVARFFDIRLVGMDFMIPDITVSWRKQHCAILELNSMPCIEMHHFPSSGTPQNVASAVVDLFFKYYTNQYER